MLKWSTLCEHIEPYGNCDVNDFTDCYPSTNWADVITTRIVSMYGRTSHVGPPGTVRDGEFSSSDSPRGTGGTKSK